MARGVTALEATIVVILLGAALGVASVYQRQVIRRAKEVALAAELKNLRASLVFFEAVRKRRPDSLEELVADAKRRGQSASAGQGADVFGNIYVYDAKTGTIRSGTQGYESW
jgi:hypothetical protein